MHIALVAVVSALALGPSYAQAAGAASSMVISQLPASVVAGSPTGFVVTAVDSTGATATGYTGTVTFWSNYPSAGLPANYKFTATDQGSHRFTFAPTAAGNELLQALDAGNSAINGYGNTTVVATSASQFSISNLVNAASLPAGQRTSFTLTAYDRYWNVAAGYAGTAVFTSSDPAATLPQSPAFSSGTASGIPVTFNTPGGQSLTATDSALASMTDTAWATVTGAAPPVATITAPASATSGVGGYAASVPTQSGVTYAWTISNGNITAGQGTSQVTFTAGSPGTLSLTAVVKRTSDGVSSTGTASVTVSGSSGPVQPTVTATSPVTTGTSSTASVVAHSGMSYVWTISGGTITSAGGASGVTANGTNTITYTAGPPGTISLSAVEKDGTGTASPPGTASVTVVGAPATPVLTSPAGPLAVGSTGNSASVAARAGMSYRWTLSSATITSAGGPAGVTSGGNNSITFTVGQGASVSISVVEVNQAGATSAPATSTIPIAAGTAGTGRMYFVAHQDDDIYFDNPDLENDILAGLPVRTVYVVAAGSPDTATYLARENGIRNAQAAMAGTTSDWSCGPAQWNAKTAQLCTLNPNPKVSTVFMRLPDGALNTLWATNPGAPFYVTPASSLTTADGAAKYTHQDLINTIAAMIGDYKPFAVSTMDNTLSYGDDNQDHVSVGLFTLEAVHIVNFPVRFKVYRAYSVSGLWYTVPAPEAVNLSNAEYTEKRRIATAYDGGFPVGSAWDNFMSREYTIVGIAGGTGPLMEPGGRCLDTNGGATASGTALVVAACSGGATQTWTIGTLGAVQGAAGRCLAATAAGPVLADCSGAVSQQWTLLSNGQLRGLGATCLGIATDNVSIEAQLCAPDSSGSQYVPSPTQRWLQQAQAAVRTSSNGDFSDSSLGTSVTTLLVGDINGDHAADVCMRQSDGLHCAINGGTGALGAAYLASGAFSDAAGWGTQSTGQTLMLGDIDHSGRASVCGRSASGIVCALAQPDGRSFGPAVLWTSSFSDAGGFGPSTTYWKSIRIGDIDGSGYASICGRNASGVWCALNNRQGGFSPASLWIASDFTDALGYAPDKYNSTLQLGRVSGSGRADVCMRAPAGIRCAVSTGSAFVNAHQWSFRGDFSDAAGWGSSSNYYGSIQLIDIDGSGYASACGRSVNGLVCAHSTGAHFDGAQAVLTTQFTDAQGWNVSTYGASLRGGDINRDGRMDICGRDANGIVCSVSA